MIDFDANESCYDILIVGGGVVGCTLALALKPLNLRVALVEPNWHQHPTDSFDVRQIALSYGSSLIFKGIGVWSKLLNYATEIKTIHVSHARHLGAVLLDAKDQGLASLGYVVELNQMHHLLMEEIKQSKIDLYCPYRVDALNQSSSCVTVNISNSDQVKKIKTKTLVATDGVKSFVRQKLNIIPDVYDYNQTAILTNIGLKRNHHNVAYERFYPDGPLAMLPLGDKRVSLVWTQKTIHADRLLAMSDAEFLATLQKTFGYRLGRLIKVGRRGAFALTRVTHKSISSGRIFFLGSAANHLHPVAGQGLNMALRDIATFTQLQKEAIDEGFNKDSHKISELYRQKRTKDQSHVRALTHGFVKLFSNDSALLGLLNGFALRRLERLPIVKKWLNDKMMGLGEPEGALFFGSPLCHDDQQHLQEETRGQ